MVILGIDPGSTRIGYGAIKKDRGELSHLASGLLRIPAGTKARQLVSLQTEFDLLLQELKPDRVAVERIFFSKNRKTAIDVAQARGVIVAAIARRGIHLVELTPPEIKLAVTGDGTASKIGVALMVSRFLALPNGRRIDDVTDALAAAIAASTNSPLW